MITGTAFSIGLAADQRMLFTRGLTDKALERDAKARVPSESLAKKLGWG